MVFKLISVTKVGLRQNQLSFTINIPYHIDDFLCQDCLILQYLRQPLPIDLA
jgi:hypothetical protein